MALGEVQDKFTIKNLVYLEVIPEGQLAGSTWIGAMDVEVEMTGNGQKLILKLKERGNGTDGD